MTESTTSPVRLADAPAFAKRMTVADLPDIVSWRDELVQESGIDAATIERLLEVLAVSPVAVTALLLRMDNESRHVCERLVRYVETVTEDGNANGTVDPIELDDALRSPVIYDENGHRTFLQLMALGFAREDIVDRFSNYLPDLD